MNPSCFFTLEFLVGVVAGVIAGNCLFWGVIVCYLEYSEWRNKRRVRREMEQMRADREKGRHTE